MTYSDGVITMIRGDTEAFNVSATEDGEAKALTVGDTVYFTVKRNTNTEGKILQKVITEFDEGKALVTILPTDTADIKPDNYVYDMQITFASGEVKTVLSPNTFVLSAEVTYE